VSQYADTKLKYLLCAVGHYGIDYRANFSLYWRSSTKNCD